MLACLVLSACAGAPPPRATIPIAVPCKTEAVERPVWATEALPRDANIFDKAKALLAEIEQRKAYEMKLEAAVTACR